MSRTNIAIIGGGIVGLSIARELLGRGADVTVFERGKVGREASYVAGGMLAASAEMGFEEFDLYRLCAESLSRWSAYASGLSQETGVDVDYRSEGSLIVAEDRDAAEALRRAGEKVSARRTLWESVEPLLNDRDPEDTSLAFWLAKSILELSAWNVADGRPGEAIRLLEIIDGLDLPGEEVARAKLRVLESPKT